MNSSAAQQEAARAAEIQPTTWKVEIHTQLQESIVGYLPPAIIEAHSILDKGACGLLQVTGQEWIHLTQAQEVTKERLASLRRLVQMRCDVLKKATKLLKNEELKRLATTWMNRIESDAKALQPRRIGDAQPQMEMPTTPPTMMTIVKRARKYTKQWRTKNAQNLVAEERTQKWIAELKERVTAIPTDVNRKLLMYRIEDEQLKKKLQNTASKLLGDESEQPKSHLCTQADVQTEAKWLEALTAMVFREEYNATSNHVLKIELLGARGTVKKTKGNVNSHIPHSLFTACNDGEINVLYDDGATSRLPSASLRNEELGIHHSRRSLRTSGSGIVEAQQDEEEAEAEE